MNIHPTKRIPLANLLIELLKVDSEQALELVDFLASADDQAEVEGGLNWRDRDGGLIPESEAQAQQDRLDRWDGMTLATDEDHREKLMQKIGQFERKYL